MEIAVLPNNYHVHKGIVLSSCAHPYVIPKLYDFCFSMEHNGIYFKKCFGCFGQYNESQWDLKNAGPY